ncbi:hypothetical protein ACJX0J_019279, partial [Zea mays]
YVLNFHIKVAANLQTMRMHICITLISMIRCPDRKTSDSPTDGMIILDQLVIRMGILFSFQIITKHFDFSTCITLLWADWTFIV